MKRVHIPLHPVAIVTLWALTGLPLAGCLGLDVPLQNPGRGELRLESDLASPGAAMVGGLQHAHYRLNDKSSITIVLSDQPLRERWPAVTDVAESRNSVANAAPDDPAAPAPAYPATPPLRRVLIARVFWQPIAGRTPIDLTATNAQFTYIIFSGEPSPTTAGITRPVGIYEGAGFCYLTRKPGGPSIDASIWDATLELTSASPGFSDLLGRATLRGSFNARRRDMDVTTDLRRLGVLTSQRIGFPVRLSRNDRQPSHRG